MDNKLTVKFNNLKFKPKDALGAGFFGEVFKVTDGKNYDDRFVAKVFSTPKVLALINRLGYGVTFERETKALKFLGPKNISPKLYYEQDTLTKRYYVMEAMNITLDEILRGDKFTVEHLKKLNKLLKRLFRTKYRHGDLHINNIMWSNMLDDFRIVDWGMYDIDTKNNTTQSIKPMIKSGDMFNLIQLYVAYRMDEIDEPSDWESTFKEFLKLVPDSEALSEKLSKKELKHRIKISIKDYLKKDSSNKRRSKLKTKKNNSSRLRYREAEKLLREPSNTAFIEMQNMTSRPRPNNSSYRTYENIEPEIASKSSSNKRTVKRKSSSSRSTSSRKSSRSTSSRNAN
jgi:hypothetical protein